MSSANLLAKSRRSSPTETPGAALAYERARQRSVADAVIGEDRQGALGLDMPPTLLARADEVIE
jgi:hypothetical protein